MHKIWIECLCSRGYYAQMATAVKCPHCNAIWDLHPINPKTGMRGTLYQKKYDNKFKDYLSVVTEHENLLKRLNNLPKQIIFR